MYPTYLSHVCRTRGALPTPFCEPTDGFLETVVLNSNPSGDELQGETLLHLQNNLSLLPASALFSGWSFLWTVLVLVSSFSTYLFPYPHNCLLSSLSKIHALIFTQTLGSQDRHIVDYERHLRSWPIERISQMHKCHVIIWVDRYHPLLAGELESKLLIRKPPTLLKSRFCELPRYCTEFSMHLHRGNFQITTRATEATRHVNPRFEANLIKAKTVT